ncbi:MAG: FlxA-like family protein [Planctomycetota bacterium]
MKRFGVFGAIILLAAASHAASNAPAYDITISIADGALGPGGTAYFSVAVVKKGRLSRVALRSVQATFPAAGTVVPVRAIANSTGVFTGSFQCSPKIVGCLLYQSLTFGIYRTNWNSIIAALQKQVKKLETEISSFGASAPGTADKNSQKIAKIQSRIQALNKRIAYYNTPTASATKTIVVGPDITPPNNGSSAAGTDTTPPTISNVYPADGSTVYDPWTIIQAQISDSGSGVDWSSLFVTFDGNDVTASPAFAITATGFTYTLSPDVPAAIHTVEVSVKDNSGNPADVQWSFVYDPLIVFIIWPYYWDAGGDGYYFDDFGDYYDDGGGDDGGDGGAIDGIF